MTADERIEKLLNRFGQTISDLPKANNTRYAYTDNHCAMTISAAYKFNDYHPKNYTLNIVIIHILTDYICHLADVIDRMEIALETAVRCTDCGTCEFEHTEECEGIIECNYRICDGCLMDSDGMEGC